MDRLNANILSVCENRGSNNGDVISDRQRVIDAGRENVRGVKLIIEREMKKCVLECYEEPERILRLKGKHFNISTAVIYGLRAKVRKKKL